MRSFLMYALVSAFIFVGCSEHQIETTQMDKSSDEVYSYNKKLVVSDAMGTNSAKYAVYSDDENILNNFITENAFELVVDSAKFNEVLKNSSLKRTSNSYENLDETMFLSNQEPRIVLELLDDESSNHLLLINAKDSELKSYSINYAVAMESKKDQIGVVHSGSGQSFMVMFYFKTKRLHSWSTLKTNNNGEAIKFVYDGPPTNYSWFDWRDVYKRRCTVIPHIYQGAVRNFIFVHHAHELEALVTRSKK